MTPSGKYDFLLFHVCGVVYGVSCVKQVLAQGRCEYGWNPGWVSSPRWKSALSDSKNNIKTAPQTGPPEVRPPPGPDAVGGGTALQHKHRHRSLDSQKNSGKTPSALFYRVNKKNGIFSRQLRVFGLGLFSPHTCGEKNRPKQITRLPQVYNKRDKPLSTCFCAVKDPRMVPVDW